MGLVIQTLSFVIINTLVVVLLVSAANSTTERESITINFLDEDTSINYGDVKDISNYKPNEGLFTSAGVPSWFTWFYLLIMGIWGSFIIIGWIRGQD